MTVISLVTDDVYDRKVFWKVKNCFYSFFTNDGEFVNN